MTWVANTSPVTRLGQSLSYYYLAFNIAFALIPSFGMFLDQRLQLHCPLLGLYRPHIGVPVHHYKVGTRPVDPSTQEDMKKGPLVSRKALPTAVVAMISSMNWGALTAFFSLYALSMECPTPGSSSVPLPS